MRKSTAIERVSISSGSLLGRRDSDLHARESEQAHPGSDQEMPSRLPQLLPLRQPRAASSSASLAVGLRTEERRLHDRGGPARLTSLADVPTEEERRERQDCGRPAPPRERSTDLLRGGVLFRLLIPVHGLTAAGALLPVRSERRAKILDEEHARECRPERHIDAVRDHQPDRAHPLPLHRIPHRRRERPTADNHPPRAALDPLRVGDGLDEGLGDAVQAEEGERASVRAQDRGRAREGPFRAEEEVQERGRVARSEEKED